MSQELEQSHVSNVAYVEALFEAYRENPESVDPAWREYFRRASNGDAWPDRNRLGPTVPPPGLFSGAGTGAAAAGAAAGASGAVASASRAGDETVVEDTKATGFQDRVGQLIRNYRVRGHVIARFDPLIDERKDQSGRTVPEELTLPYFNFSEAEMDRMVSCKTFQGGRQMPLRELYERLRHTYCGSVGVEYMHIDDIEVRRWLQRRLEPLETRIQLSRDEQLRILTRLTDAVMFEEFIRKKFPGAKSFSLEGSETLIPVLDLAIEKAAGQGVAEVVLGMAHRGRLNVLANIMGKSPKQIFREFADKDPDLYIGRGDVKYHLGHSSDWITATGRRVHVSMCFNPSHLEFVNTVVLGRVRAKMDRIGDTGQRSCMALIIHGDAAFAGEGVVQETLNLSQLEGYRVGGALHIIVNNQIGFTTSPRDARSCAYATDIAKMLASPIFHVNGEDPDAVALCVRVALEFRAEFRRDVFIDVYGYRRLGHNETDEPAFTQPLLYKTISRRKTVREGYLAHLLKLGGVTREEADQVAESCRRRLEDELGEANSERYQAPVDRLPGIWARSQFIGGRDQDAPDVETGVSRAEAMALLERQAEVPADFKPHAKIQKILEARREMAAGRQGLDWASAEAVAFGSLLQAGTPIRLSGQDAQRGTFSHRHVVLHDVQTGKTHTPLCGLGPKQAAFQVFNSPLSETGVIGFDYGYSLDTPDGLVLWEAQFGDFANAAQVIIDQFIVSAEDKWRRLSGLVLLLPHGFEGQGPEHSSARLERFLALAAEDNIQVCYPSTPAQYFHLLRRQVLRPVRKPLVVMTPKSLLRNPACVSSLEELGQGTFRRVIPDAGVVPGAVRRILLCTGKVYYDLVERREKLKRAEDVAVVRIEQLYPLRATEIQAALASYPEATPAVWVQEEPANMGALRYLKVQFGDRLVDRHPLSYVGRPASASPATGSGNAHKKEQARLLDEAFRGLA
ncbi:MAG: 2-oxoglutarate dehydrogenase E1 component [Verrucomicrobiales bacterium]|nr:2-oxoglutarate dehydrogenase E1 component [Verrucomicrobiales bacterium]